MFEKLGKFIKNSATVAKELGMKTIAEHGFEMDDTHQRFVLKKNATKILLRKAQQHADSMITSIELREDHIKVRVEKIGVQIQTEMSFTQIELDSSMAEILMYLASPAEISGANFFGSCIAWIWRVVLGGSLDSMAALDGVTINGNNIQYQTNASDLELVRLLVGSVDQHTKMKIDIQNHELIFTAVEPPKFTPDMLGLVTFIGGQIISSKEKQTTSE